MTVHHIRELRQQASLDIIFLMETKNPDPFVLKELNFLDPDHHFLVPPSRPNSGGLTLYWKQDIDLQILSSSKNLIDTVILYKGTTTYVSFVYGEPEVPNRSIFWDSLIDLALPRTSAWLLTGDFNEIIDNSEKSGGPERAEGTFGAFRNMLANCNLFDLQHSGNCLSWRGKRRTHLVYCRLDRSLVNPAWSDSFPTGRCQYLGFEGSDHRPLITVFDSAQRRRNRLFRFDRRLRDNEEIKELIANIWNLNAEASINDRLGLCRRAISAWTREQFFNSKEKIANLKQHLDTAMTDPLGNEELISAINGNLMAAYKEEEEFWRQRSRIMWLALGDRNSGYFHAVAKGRRARNKMFVIEDAESTAYYEEEQIAGQISTYFSEIFTSGNNDNTAGDMREIVASAITPNVSEAANERLISIPDPTEIKYALFLIHPDKAPGPDGFSASFFHSNWSTIGPSLISEIQAFFRTGRLPSATNNTHVRLIPKLTGAKLISDFRPIALCNIVYKVITKIISLRLKPTLQDIISETQSAFVPGRAISDNVLITHEILHYLKVSEAEVRRSMAVKTDMSKAYDRLE